MIICFEKSGTGIRIVPFPSHATTDFQDIIYASSATTTTNYTLEAPMLLEPEYEPSLDKEYDFIGHFIQFAGKIKMSWNAWISKYVYWEPPSLDSGTDRPLLARMRHFAGFVCHNRGRHFDRKRQS